MEETPEDVIARILPHADALVLAFQSGAADVLDARMASALRRCAQAGQAFSQCAVKFTRDREAMILADASEGYSLRSPQNPDDRP